MAVIGQIPLRNQVRDAVAQKLWSGAWSFGDDLNEARLAAELGVSRTPLREGLVMLASEGLIEAKPNRGFHVPEVDREAVAQLYPILGALEALAVRQMKDDPHKVAKDLHRINRQLAGKTVTKARRYTGDATFHERLAVACDNPLLQDELRKLWARSRGIDGALMRGMAEVEGSSTDHKEIADAIGDADLEAAAARVENHWTSGIGVVSNWIDTVLEKKE